jgi:hypothetical protein
MIADATKQPCQSPNLRRPKSSLTFFPASLLGRTNGLSGNEPCEDPCHVREHSEHDLDMSQLNTVENVQEDDHNKPSSSVTENPGESLYDREPYLIERL